MVRGHGKLVICAVFLSGLLLGGVLVYGGFVFQRPGDHAMNSTRFSVDHVRQTADRPFEEVASAFERQLGRFDPEAIKVIKSSLVDMHILEQEPTDAQMFTTKFVQ